MPITRSPSPLVRRSANRNIHTIATTLTTSGTVTNSPAMKLRRSHCHIGGHRTASQTNVAAASATRYQANTSSRWLTRNLMKYFTVK